MCEVFGYEVIQLRRIRIMNILLGSIPVGKWRYLSEPEMNELIKMIEHSSNEQQ